MVESRGRTVRLRQEREGEDSRNLWARLDDGGNLRIEGQDLGPATAIVSSDGEYEWVQTVAVHDVPRLIEVLGGSPADDVLDLLEQRYSGDASYELERKLRNSDVPVGLWVWSG